jgi:hypothetical protein
LRKNLSQLWSTSGTVNRSTYALVGLVGFAVKHNIDRLIATFGFNRPWGFFNYWVPVRDVTRITRVGSQDAVFLATLVGVALPFIWVGVTMTVKRLRSAGLSANLVALFFFPVLNLLFFLVLCLLPESDPHHSGQTFEQSKNAFLSRIVPRSSLGSAASSVLITLPVGFATTLLGARLLLNYGWGMFIALPFAMGFVAALVYSIHQRRSLKSCIGVACLSVGVLGAGLMAFALEGFFCLIMAAPLAFPLSAFGGACAYAVQKRQLRTETPVILAALLLFAPGVEWMEHIAAVPSSVYIVRTSIDVQAPPERVWKQVVAFSEIPPPTEWMFRAGIAYPIRAEMLGSGVGAERHCVFSTGSFVEPIEIWDAPRRLKFSVTSNPPPMEEWTPYSHIEPPHLHGFLVSEGGQFLLIPLANGGTHLEGTTWYRHGLWPSGYWRAWSDAIIHRIHLRVLRHIRDEVATAGASTTPTASEN